MRPLVALLLFLCVGASAWADPQERPAQGHPPEHMQLHHEHYSKWQRKDTTLHSSIKNCCGDGDCYPTAAHYDVAKGLWKAKRREDGKWLWIPKNVFDEASNDPRSADGRSHLCAVGPNNNSFGKDWIWCFRPGAGI